MDSDDQAARAASEVVALLLADRWQEVRARLEAPRLVAPGDRRVRARVDVARARLLTLDGRWEHASALLATATEDLREAGEADVDLAELLDRIGAAAVGDGSPAALRVAVRASGAELELRARLGVDTGPVEARLRWLADRGAPVHLGRVRLLEVLGTGGLGSVWRAVHDGGAAVAVKLVHVDASSASARRRVLEEVCALAALDHPNVVWLHGYGFVNAGAAAMGIGTAGAPYLVLELASGGTLADRVGRLAWDEARDALLQVLDGLAHAHARGLVHLDLKPANILIAGGHARIADFGLARMVHAAGDRVGAGTPAYMAPEQLRVGRRMGPWTDLYALGCLATELVTGEPPFGSGAALAVALGHLEDEPPALPPGAPAPEGFDAWRRRLLAKDPEDRFGSAAEAAEALAALGSTAPLPSAGWVASTSSAPTRLQAPAASGRPEGPHTLILEAPAPPAAPIPVSEAGRRRRPVPERFATGEGPRRTTQVEASLQLFPLRAPPIVGRLRERRLLWAALRDVARRSTSLVAAVQGAPGVGTSRLGQWLAERAVELDVARVVRLPATPSAGVLAAALAADLGLREGAGPDDPVLLRAVPDRFEREALADAAAGRVESERTVRRLWSRHLARLASAGPVIVLLDDPGPDDLARSLVAEVAGGSSPVLFVGLVRSEDDPLLQLPEAVGVRVDPMPDDDLGRLLDARLPLDALLRRRLVVAAAGRPATAVQILADLVSRRALVPGSGGWTLAPGVDPALPTDHRRALRARIAAAGLVDVLAVLAVTGGADEDTLSAVAARAGVPFSREAVERAVALGLADRGREGPQLPPAHAAAVLDAVDAGRLRALHAAAATLARDPVRVARHQVGAGEPLRALEPLAKAVRAALERPEVAADLLRAWAEALRGAGVPPEDPRWADWWIQQADLGMVANDDRILAPALSSLDEGRARHGWRVDAARLARWRGDVLRIAHRWEEAARVWTAIVEDAPPSTPEERVLHGGVWYRLALAAGKRQDEAGARALLRRAAELQPPGSARCGTCVLLAHNLAQAGDLEGAARAIELGAEGAEGPLARTVITQARALVAAAAGDHERAVALHREVVARHEVLGFFRPGARLHLAAALLLAGRDDEARAELELVGGQVAPGTDPGRYLRALWIVAVAGEVGDRFERLLAEHGDATIEPELVAEAARRARAAGHAERADLLAKLG